MIIPLRTDRVLRRRPLATEGLILVNMLVYLIGVGGAFFDWFPMARFIDAGHFDPRAFKVWQLLTYQFLHDPGGIWHLAFNMLFLWVFGCAVEDRLGRVAYLAFYLIGGAVAGLAHGMISPHPVIGASGSISAITGGFLALFPRSRIKILFFFILIGVYSIPSLWFIGFYFAIDVIRQTSSLLGRSEDQVAYMAHIAGSMYGFGLGFTLLGLKIVKREDMDVFFLFKQMRRRAAFRAAGRGQVGGLWDSAPADTGTQVHRSSREAKPSSDEQVQRGEIRARISAFIGDHDLSAASAEYGRLLDEDPQATLSEAQQTDIANHLYATREYERAAQAYELLLARYPNCQNAAEIRLMLGLTYARQLGRPDRARELIEQARSSVTDPGQQKLAQQLLSELEPTP